MSDENPCLFEDFWFEVLKKLPVKTLGKCRCVCKSWHSLIISPSFITAHLKNYSQNEDLARIPISGRYEQYLFYTEGDVSLQACHTSNFPWKVEWDLKFCLDFVGCVHGLVCLANDARINHKTRILLWNPLLQKCISLPESAAASNVTGGEVSCVLGFGYDDKRNDHRVVKISYGSQGKERSETAGPFVEVYSVQEQTWRVIPADYLVNNGIDHIRRIDSSHCFLNGIIHWFTWEDQHRSRQGNWLLLFNVAEEKFERMALPASVEDLRVFEYGVFVYQNKLSFFRWKYLSRQAIQDYALCSCYCQIWVKGEYDVGSLWCKILEALFIECVHVEQVSYLRRNGMQLHLASNAHIPTGVFFSYPKPEASRHLDLRQLQATKFNAYTESLVVHDHEAAVSTQFTVPDGLKRYVSDDEDDDDDYIFNEEAFITSAILLAEALTN